MLVSISFGSLSYLVNLAHIQLGTGMHYHCIGDLFLWHTLQHTVTEQVVALRGNLAFRKSNRGLVTAKRFPLEASISFLVGETDVSQLEKAC